MQQFKFKRFQFEDIAAAALVDGVVGAWDTGLGKTIFSAIWPLLKCGYDKVIGPVGKNGLPGTRTLSVRAPVLLVIPGDLHDKTEASLKKLFGISITRLAGHAEFHRVTGGVTNAEGIPIVPPGFYMTSYTQLTTNGVEKMPDPDKLSPVGSVDPRALLERLALKEDPQVSAFFRERGKVWRDYYDALKLNPASATNQSLADNFRRLTDETFDTHKWQNPKFAAAERDRLQTAHDVVVNLVCNHVAPEYNDLRHSQHTWIIREFMVVKLEEYSEHAGDIGYYKVSDPSSQGLPPRFHEDLVAEGAAALGPMKKIKCIYSPSLSDLSRDSFDCVCVDEGVKMKGTSTMIGQGVRQMNPRHRLVLSATPVKNRLPDIFWLAHWAAGSKLHAHARWPYNDDPAEHAAFSRQFMLTEYNLSKAAEDEAARDDGRDLKRAGKPRRGKAVSSRYAKQRPEICNVHLVWKLFGGILLRRLKANIGEDIVKKVRKVYRVPMGFHQKGVYKYHVRDGIYVDHAGNPAPGAQLQALRSASSCPDSHLLQPQAGGDWLACCDKFGSPVGRSDTSGKCRSCGSPPIKFRTDRHYNPKIATTLTLIEEILRRRETVAVFSAFHDPSDRLSDALRQAKVDHYLLDGRCSHAKRAVYSERFVQGFVPVVLAGLDSMAEGHDWHHCRNVIITSYTWAADKVIQAVNRAHRIISQHDINVYVILTEGTADRVLEDNINEKNNAANLAVDGDLMAEPVEEMSIAQLLRLAAADFNDKATTVNEDELYREWPALRDKLAASYAAWKAQSGHPAPSVTALLPNAPSPANAALAPCNIIDLSAVFKLTPPAWPAARPYVPAWRRTTQ
jgi:hypothetical protein